MTLAKAVVTGTVYRKPQTGYSTNDVAISSFTIDIGEKEETLIRVISKRTSLSDVVSGLEKGQRVLVEGRLQIGNAKMDDGSERRVFEIDANTAMKILIYLGIPREEVLDVYCELVSIENYQKYMPEIRTILPDELAAKMKSSN